VLAFLSTLPRLKRTANLLLAALTFLQGGPPADAAQLHDRVVGEADRLRSTMLTRATQTTGGPGHDPAHRSSRRRSLRRHPGWAQAVGCPARRPRSTSTTTGISESATMPTMNSSTWSRTTATWPSQ
jgi:hypothetical protein